MRNLMLFFSLLLLFASCVAPTKFRELQNENISCQDERDQLKADNEKLTVDHKELTAKLEKATRDLAKAGKDTLKWKEEANRLNHQNNLLTRDYNDLSQAQQALAKGSEEEIRRLMDELQLSQKDLQKRELDLGKISADVTARKAELNAMQTELNKRNKKLAELEQVLQDQQATLSALRKKVSDALLSFENQGLTVSQKNGNVYVSLDEQLLFKSGSTALDPKGINALKKLARVLEQNTDINVMIEGHTDDVPVITGSVYKDNWDLSVLRATSIARILLDGTSINPQRITTAGRSQFMPVDRAKTAEARQKNRRTEIILSPKLDELYRLIQ
jgi:chemotaxis protein MotB